MKYLPCLRLCLWPFPDSFISTIWTCSCKWVRRCGWVTLLPSWESTFLSERMPSAKETHSDWCFAYDMMWHATVAQGNLLTGFCVQIMLINGSNFRSWFWNHRSSLGQWESLSGRGWAWAMLKEPIGLCFPEFNKTRLWMVNDLPLETNHMRCLLCIVQKLYPSERDGSLAQGEEARSPTLSGVCGMSGPDFFFKHSSLLVGHALKEAVVILQVYCIENSGW